MQIPYESLSLDTLQRVIEEFVSREGTDYSHNTTDLLTKVEQIRRQLKSGAAVLCYDELSESCHIVSREAFRSLEKSRAQAGSALSKDVFPDL